MNELHNLIQAFYVWANFHDQQAIELSFALNLVALVIGVLAYRHGSSR